MRPKEEEKGERTGVRREDEEEEQEQEKVAAASVEWLHTCELTHTHCSH